MSPNVFHASWITRTRCRASGRRHRSSVTDRAVCVGSSKNALRPLFRAGSSQTLLRRQVASIERVASLAKRPREGDGEAADRAADAERDPELERHRVSRGPASMRLIHVCCTPTRAPSIPCVNWSRRRPALTARPVRWRSPGSGGQPLASIRWSAVCSMSDRTFLRVLHPVLHQPLRQPATSCSSDLSVEPFVLSQTGVPSGRTSPSVKPGRNTRGATSRDHAHAPSGSSPMASGTRRPGIERAGPRGPALSS